jgi:hypothetical protein
MNQIDKIKKYKRQEDGLYPLDAKKIDMCMNMRMRTAMSIAMPPPSSNDVFTSVHTNTSISSNNLTNTQKTQTT